MINNKIKSFLKLKNIKNSEYSNELNLSSIQALNTKFVRNSFKIQDIILLAKISNSKLAIIDENEKPILIFDEHDIEEKQ